MNNYVISDIHGNSERLFALLKILKKKHPKGDFVLHIIGDLFDRGDSSSKVFEIIKQNQKYIKVIKGNHEDLFMNFMENPELNYAKWQINFSYPTIISFLYDQFETFIYQNRIKIKELSSDYSTNYKRVNARIVKMFNNTKEDVLSKYIKVITNTISNRDKRSPRLAFLLMIDQIYPELSTREKALIEQIGYVRLIDKFCDVYEYFKNLPNYAEINGKFLLVHSGFVKNNIKSNEYDSCGEVFYKHCEMIKELKYQNALPMLWSRRIDLSSDKPITPGERFDNHVIVFGHTTTDKFNLDNSLRPIFTYNNNGKLVSIGIDGRNYDYVEGELNCINLENLSQMILTGSTEMQNGENVFPLNYFEIPYKNPFNENDFEQYDNQKTKL